MARRIEVSNGTSELVQFCSVREVGLVSPHGYEAGYGGPGEGASLSSFYFRLVTFR